VDRAADEAQHEEHERQPDRDLEHGPVRHRRPPDSRTVGRTLRSRSGAVKSRSSARAIGREPRVWNTGPVRTARLELPQPDAVLRGPAPAEASADTERPIAERRARGLFGALRFPPTTPPRSCHPERLVRRARTVIAAVLPLGRPEPPRPAGPTG